MRIVYHGEGAGIRGIPPVRPSSRVHRETVLIISTERKPRDKTDAAEAAPGEGYELRLSDEARARDGEVRAHEQAHLAVLGSAAASGIIYDTARGPGGETVAVGGRIAVDLTEVPGDPDATMRKARSIIAAANAPGSPSAADLRTAAKAYELAHKAQRDLRGSVDLLA